ncbi:hypothetical protein NDU88_003654 [Pleurodeles waltl]|uniref:Uncharacterized protein n=1 Tax=Pleurodeles waltl TaxID=8319 RepID=A0AAV7VES8_PLEWA|nr:hypothetical protein NDU88_003654 [Pleurodeles waltl]
MSDRVPWVHRPGFVVTSAELRPELRQEVSLRGSAWPHESGSPRPSGSTGPEELLKGPKVVLDAGRRWWKQSAVVFLESDGAPKLWALMLPTLDWHRGSGAAVEARGEPRAVPGLAHGAPPACRRLGALLDCSFTAPVPGLPRKVCAYHPVASSEACVTGPAARTVGARRSCVVGCGVQPGALLNIYPADLRLHMEYVPIHP